MTIKHASQYCNVKEYLGISKLPNHQIRQKMKENMGHESTVLMQFVLDFYIYTL